MSGGIAFQQIGYTGHAPGTASFSESGVTWTGRNNSTNEKIDKDSILRMTWSVFGSKGHIVVYLNDGSHYRMDGFEPTKFDDISQYLSRHLNVTLEQSSVSFNLVKTSLIQFH